MTGVFRPASAAHREEAENLPIEVRDGRGRFQFYCTSEEAAQAEAAGLGVLRAGGRVLRIIRDNGQPHLNSGDGTARVLGTRHQALGWQRHREHTGGRI